MDAHSMDLRVRVLADSDAGLPAKAVAEKYRVSKSWIRRLKKRVASRERPRRARPVFATSRSGSGTRSISATRSRKSPTLRCESFATSSAAAQACRRSRERYVSSGGGQQALRESFSSDLSSTI